MSHSNQAEAHLDRLRSFTENLISQRANEGTPSSDALYNFGESLGSEIEVQNPDHLLPPSRDSTPALDARSVVSTVVGTERRFVPEGATGAPHYHHQPAAGRQENQVNGQAQPYPPHLVIDLTGGSQAGMDQPAVEGPRATLPATLEALGRLREALEEANHAKATGNIKLWEKAVTIGKLGRRDLEASLGGRKERKVADALSASHEIKMEGSVWNPYHWRREAFEKLDWDKSKSHRKRQFQQVGVERRAEAGVELLRGLRTLDEMNKKMRSEEKNRKD